VESVDDSSLPAGLQLLEDQRFVWEHVWPLVSDGGKNRPTRSRFELAIHRRREDGRAVVEYSFEGSVRVFAKLYPDDAAGRAVYRIHDELCKQGFGPDSPYRVPEPVGYLEEHGVLLLRPLGGDNLAATHTLNGEAFPEGVTRAARWLVALHSSPVRVGPCVTVAHDALRLARRAAKAVACRPDLEDIIREALAELARRCPTAEPRAPVQTHGRFHAAHVHLTPLCVSAVDLDRAALADPAKDVGQFLHALRSMRIKTGVMDYTVEEARAAFLDEYVRHRPAALSELTYYWSYCILWTLLGLTFKDRPARRGWKERVDFFQAEFHDVPRRAAALR
jgi:hypothetical protein